MKIAEVQIGQTYTYWPPQGAEDNLHFPAEVIEIGKRVKVRVKTAEGECLRHVSARRLVAQGEMCMESRGGGVTGAPEGQGGSAGGVDER